MSETVQGWPLWRRRLHAILSSSLTDQAVGMITLANLACIIMETDSCAKCIGLNEQAMEHCVSQVELAWRFINRSFVALYAVELFCRVYVYRRNVFRDRWNIFDLSIVFLSIAEVLLTAQGAKVSPSMPSLRTFRLGRLLRTVKLLRYFPELNSYIRGFIQALSAMLWGFVVILLMLLLWAIFSVTVLGPVSVTLDNEYCRTVFSSVWRATLFYFQTVVAGDSWGACTLPIVTENAWSYLVFAGAIISIQLGFMNLILSVVVEKATAVREEMATEAAKEVAKERQHAQEQFRTMCAEMDGDRNGYITLVELTEGYRSNSAVKDAMTRLDLHPDMLETVFHTVDSTQSGSVPYELFANLIEQSESQDVRRQLMFVSLRQQQLLKFMESRQKETIEALERFVDEACQRLRSPPSEPDCKKKEGTVFGRGVGGGLQPCGVKPLEKAVASTMPYFGNTTAPTSTSDRSKPATLGNSARVKMQL
mmetsp:Transcript_76027/g.211265  ORF Transcript_76027/g.211265 Transcript_76027/m.211265 type:complete len:479 (-) Transcript_76027:183-1619(-)